MSVGELSPFQTLINGTKRVAELFRQYGQQILDVISPDTTNSARKEFETAIHRNDELAYALEPKNAAELENQILAHCAAGNLPPQVFGEGSFANDKVAREAWKIILSAVDRRVPAAMGLVAILLNALQQYNHLIPINPHHDDWDWDFRSLVDHAFSCPSSPDNLDQQLVKAMCTTTNGAALHDQLGKIEITYHDIPSGSDENAMAKEYEIRLSREQLRKPYVLRALLHHMTHNIFAPNSQNLQAINGFINLLNNLAHREFLA